MLYICWFQLVKLKSPWALVIAIRIYLFILQFYGLTIVKMNYLQPCELESWSFQLW